MAPQLNGCIIGVWSGVIGVTSAGILSHAPAYFANVVKCRECRQMQSYDENVLPRGPQVCHAP
jgi:hypothetical protein